jgi:hypothetical protein
MKKSRGQTPVKSLRRRDFLIKVAGGAIATTAFGAITLRGWAADIDQLLPTNPSMHLSQNT